MGTKLTKKTEVTTTSIYRRGNWEGTMTQAPGVRPTVQIKRPEGLRVE